MMLVKKQEAHDMKEKKHTTRDKNKRWYSTVYVLMDSSSGEPEQNLLGHVLMFSGLENAEIGRDKMHNKKDFSIQKFHMELVPCYEDEDMGSGDA